FPEAGDLVLPLHEIERPKAALRLDCGQGGQHILAAMEGNRFGDIYVADTIAVGETERLIANVISNALETTAGHGPIAGIHQRHSPGFHPIAVDLHFVFHHVKGDVTHVEEIGGEVLFDHVRLVSTADDKVFDAMAGVDL